MTTTPGDLASMTVEQLQMAIRNEARSATVNRHLNELVRRLTEMERERDHWRSECRAAQDDAHDAYRQLDACADDYKRLRAEHQP